MTVNSKRAYPPFCQYLIYYSIFWPLHSFINTVYFVSISLRTLYCPEICLLFCLPMELATSRFIWTTDYQLPTTNYQLLPHLLFHSNTLHLMFCLHLKIIGGFMGFGWASGGLGPNQGPTNPQPRPNQNPIIKEGFQKNNRADLVDSLIP